MKKTMILTVSLLFTAGCGGDDAATLSLNLTNVTELGSDYVYEGWLITPEGPVSSGRFTIDDQGALSPASFSIDPATEEVATAFVLTIEPAVDDDPAPASTHILAGPLASGAATLTTSDAAALGSDFSSAAGSYILATPSTASITADESQGIWWLSPGTTMTASLTLPTLPDGWVYEGWVVGSAGPVSTGRFTAADVADSDGAGATAGSDGTPPFPGQDFISPAMDLIGGAAVISVEPMPDDSPMPFILKPLLDDNIEDIAPPNAQAMANNAAATLPSGSVTIGLE